MHEGTRRILSVLLRQLQGLVDTSNVVVIGATNRKADLDPAPDELAKAGLAVVSIERR